MKIEFNHLNGYIGITIIGIGDYNVESIIIPETINGYPVTEIGDLNLWASKLKSIIIPKSVIEIKSNAFYGSPNINIINGEFIENDFIIINNRFIFDGNYVFLIKYQISDDYVICRKEYEYQIDNACVYCNEYDEYFINKVWYNNKFRP